MKRASSRSTCGGSTGIIPEPLWVASLRDVGEERRKEALQRLFFHDVLNVVGGIRGLAQLIPEMGEPDRAECLSLLDRLSMQLTDMIGGHRDLLWAEKGDLQAVPDPVGLRGWMNDLVGLYIHHPVAEGRTIAFDAPPSIHPWSPTSASSRGSSAICSRTPWKRAPKGKPSL